MYDTSNKHYSEYLENIFIKKNESINFIISLSQDLQLRL